MRAAAIKLWDIRPQIHSCFVIFNREFTRFFVITKIKFAHFFVFLLAFVIKCVYYNREKIEMRWGNGIFTKKGRLFSGRMESR